MLSKKPQAINFLPSPTHPLMCPFEVRLYHFRCNVIILCMNYGCTLINQVTLINQLTIYLSIFLSIYLSIYLSIDRSIHPSIDTYIYIVYWNFCIMKLLTLWHLLVVSYNTIWISILWNSISTKNVNFYIMLVEIKLNKK